MKRITFFINSLYSGGAEHQLSMLANFLVEKKYDVSIVTLASPPDHYILDSKVKRISIASRNGVLKLISLWKFLLTEETDCVIVYCQRNSFFALPALLFRKKIKVICGERNLTIGKQGRIEKLLFDFLYKRANYIVPNSHSQCLYIKKIAPWLKEKIVPIINYTSLEEYCFKINPNNDIVKIGVFCRYEKQKNCIGLIDAISLVKKRCDVEFKVFWYGNRNFNNPILLDYYYQLEKHILECNLQNVVILNDAVKDVANKMALYDGICLASFFEGFSNTISEAICCGRPVICSDVSDNSLMVHDKENGFLFNPNDIESMADAFLSFINLSFDDRIAMGIKSREIAESLFDKAKFINSYIELIEESK